MNTSPFLPLRLSRFREESALTIVEIVVGLGLLAILAILLMPCTGMGGLVKGRMADQLNNGKQIYYAMRSYASETAHEGAFPTYAESNSKKKLFTTSNDVFSALLPRYLDEKYAFPNKLSAWCKKVQKGSETSNVVLPGENDWCYMRGLRENSNARWPLLANAFVPGTTHYVKDQSKPGGVWKGVDAIVIWAGGSAEMVETRPQGDHFFVPRSDKPTANAFEKDGEWLAGENVQLLYPAAP